jgi:hypothetical protein
MVLFLIVTVILQTRALVRFFAASMFLFTLHVPFFAAEGFRIVVLLYIHWTLWMIARGIWLDFRMIWLRLGPFI